MKRSQSPVLEETKIKRVKTDDDNMLEKWFPNRTKMPEGNQVYSFEKGGKKQIVKIYPKSTRADMAKREIKILQAIEKYCDPYFLCSSDMKEDSKNFYIVTEFLEEFSDLYTLWIPIANKNITLSVQEYTQLFCSLIQGLLKLHNLGIAHRDIKPGNIMIKMITDENKDRKFVIKYIDFGQSCLVNECKVAFPGTTMYKPPEFFRYGHNADFESAQKEDYWALGMTFLDLIMGGRYHDKWYDKYSKTNEKLNDAIRRNLSRMDDELNFMEFMPADFPEKMPTIYNLLVNMLQRDPDDRNIPKTFLDQCFAKTEEITPTPKSDM